MKHFDDIKDNEIRIINCQETEQRPAYRRRWLWVVLAAVLLILAIVLVFWLSRPENGSDAPAIDTKSPVAVAPTIVKSEPAEVLVRDTIINDVPLSLFTPVNAMPKLSLGIPDTTDQSLILALQAADIRADNNKIVGAFVLQGELLARGVAKKGFCAILDGKIQLGMAESTPLFEETTAKNGYFFRQYPLVNKGVLVENNPKNKAIRHALCELDGQIVVVSSTSRESFHDFAQALVDLGVVNAIALTGGDAFGFRHDSKNGLLTWGSDLKKSKNIPGLNFIVWRSAK